MCCMFVWLTMLSSSAQILSAIDGSAAGANLAASVAILARDRGTPLLVHQVLFYPLVEAPEALGEQPRPSVSGEPVCS